MWEKNWSFAFMLQEQEHVSKVAPPNSCSRCYDVNVSSRKEAFRARCHAAAFFCSPVFHPPRPACPKHVQGIPNSNIIYTSKPVVVVLSTAVPPFLFAGLRVCYGVLRKYTEMDQSCQAHLPWQGNDRWRVIV